MSMHKDNAGGIDPHSNCSSSARETPCQRLFAKETARETPGKRLLGRYLTIK